MMTTPSPFTAVSSSRQHRLQPRFVETEFLFDEQDDDYSGFAPTQMAPSPRESRPFPDSRSSGEVGDELRVEAPDTMVLPSLESSARSHSPSLHPKSGRTAVRASSGKGLTLAVCIAGAVVMASAILPLIVWH